MLFARRSCILLDAIAEVLPVAARQIVGEEMFERDFCERRGALKVGACAEYYRAVNVVFPSVGHVGVCACETFVKIDFAKVDREVR